jgi:hypothetical protein
VVLAAAGCASRVAPGDGGQEPIPHPADGGTGPSHGADGVAAPAGDVGGLLPDPCPADQEGLGFRMTVQTTRFAFGGTPTESHDGAGDRWTGPDGEFLIDAMGCSSGVLNGGAPEAGLPDWSSDPDALTKHVVDYFVGAGLPRCQIAHVGILAGSTGRNVDIDGRQVAGFAVVGSGAWARLDSQDDSTAEMVCWPTIPTQVIDQARAFRMQLADPSGWAAYQAFLPEDARGGQGEVQIQHGGFLQPGAPQAVYHVFVTSSGSDLYFDPHGNMVTPY